MANVKISGLAAAAVTAAANEFEINEAGTSKKVTGLQILTYVFSPNDIEMSGTGSLKVPTGTTGERSASAANGMFRYNTSLAEFEGYAAGAWGSIGGGASANGAIYENSDTISTNYTISTGTNGMSVGPMVIAGGVTVTIPSGQRWVVL